MLDSLIQLGDGSRPILFRFCDGFGVVAITQVETRFCCEVGIRCCQGFGKQLACLGDFSLAVMGYRAVVCQLMACRHAYCCLFVSSQRLIHLPINQLLVGRVDSRMAVLFGLLPQNGVSEKNANCQSECAN